MTGKEEEEEEELVGGRKQKTEGRSGVAEETCGTCTATVSSSEVIVSMSYEKTQEGRGGENRVAD